MSRQWCVHQTAHLKTVISLGNWTTEAVPQSVYGIWVQGELDIEHFKVKGGGRGEKQRTVRFANEPSKLRAHKANCPTKVDMHLGMEFKLPEWLYSFLDLENETLFFRILHGLLTPVETMSVEAQSLCDLGLLLLAQFGRRLQKHHRLWLLACRFWKTLLLLRISCKRFLLVYFTCYGFNLFSTCVWKGSTYYHLH